MPAISVAERSHRRNVIIVCLVGNKILRAYGRLFAVYDLICAGFGDDDLFAHMADDLVSHNKDRLTEALRHIESFDCYLVAFLDRGGSIGYRSMIAMCSPFGLHYVSLRNFRRKAC